MSSPEMDDAGSWTLSGVTMVVVHFQVMACKIWIGVLGGGGAHSWVATPNRKEAHPALRFQALTQKGSGTLVAMASSRAALAQHEHHARALKKNMARDLATEWANYLVWNLATGLEELPERPMINGLVQMECSSTSQIWGRER
jgi:hypothetical protein